MKDTASQFWGFTSFLLIFKMRNQTIDFNKWHIDLWTLSLLSLHLFLQSQQVLEVQQPVHEGGVRLPQVCAQRLDELRRRGAQEGSGRGGDHHRGGGVAGRGRAGCRGDPSPPAGAGRGHAGSAFVLPEVRHASAPPLLPEIPPGQGVDGGEWQTAAEGQRENEGRERERERGPGEGGNWEEEEMEEEEIMEDGRGDNVLRGGWWWKRRKKRP